MIPCIGPVAASLPPTPCTQATAEGCIGGAGVFRSESFRALGPSGAFSEPAVGQGQGPFSEVHGPCPQMERL